MSGAATLDPAAPAAVREYIRASWQWVLADRPDDDMDQLDRLWYRLSEEEQAQASAMLSHLVSTRQV